MGRGCKNAGFGYKGGMAEKYDIEAIRDFIKTVKRTYEAGGATEHTYRPALTLLCDTVSDGGIKAINERKRIAYGAPDITMMHNDIAIGYLEAKDIGIDIRKFKDANKNQFERYSQNLDNLIYTDCLKWDFYRNGERIRSISIAELVKGVITPKPTTYNKLGDYLQEFLGQRPKTIKSAEELIEHTAKKTLIMRHAFEEGLLGEKPIKSLKKQHRTVVKELISGLSEEEFADMYAQTITYGLFAAWFDNKKLNKFNRHEIEELLPDDYLFLKNLFVFITSKKMPTVLEWAINDLIALYQAADVEKIKESYRQNRGRGDLFMHFYEDFLQQYDAKKRKAHGVYFTPEPVVDFIVRGVDWVLKTKFNLKRGLANTEKIIPPKQSDSVHRVQILDPATGTGTFLAQTIRHIKKEVDKSTPDNWSSYVDKDLLPRLNGFEMLIAPYTMCYMKLDRVLRESEYVATDDRPERLHIYLTDSLTEANNDITEIGYDDWIEKEAQGATDIKQAQPIMCVIGNPPYLGESNNNDPWILKLIKDYRKEPGGKKDLKEKTSKWLNDDYVKFIRLAQHMVDKNGDDPKNKNGEGVVGMITNHNYLENATFRGMRWHLMNSFDGIYILDLHGDYVKNKTVPDGKADKNVFEITTGVSIIIAWKTKQAKGTEKSLAKVFRGDVRGAYKKKEKFLLENNLDTKEFKELDVRAPDYYFKPVDHKLKTKYNKGFKITDFMKIHGVGMTTAHDSFCMGSKADLIKKFEKFKNTQANEDLLHGEFGVKKKKGWSILKAHKSLSKIDDVSKLIQPVMYRLFDNSYILYHDDVVWRTVRKIMHHLSKEGNLGLLVKRQCRQDFSHAFITDKITESCVFESAGANNSILPLYLYRDEKNPESKEVNMDETIRKAIEDIATDSKHGKPDEYAIFDYIYAVLHAPDYRKLYNEFLKKAFPHIPYPKDSAEFWYLSSVGTKLRKLHLMEKLDSPVVYTFKGTGDGIVKKGKKFPHWNNDKIFINDAQYFDNVPESAWDLFIGGRQPAQKWLEDRRGLILETEDQLHYQDIIAVLVQTKTTMDEIEWSRP